MGSRSFYEGWDSNRPNVITFINIGDGRGSAVNLSCNRSGAGVRIEPMKGKRKRHANLHNAGEVQKQLYQLTRSRSCPQWNRSSSSAPSAKPWSTILDGLAQEQEKEVGVEPSLTW